MNRILLFYYILFYLISFINFYCIENIGKIDRMKGLYFYNK